MRILLWNRADALTAPGGDTTQWRETGRYLGELGLEAIPSTEPHPSVSDVDLVHLFNLQCAEAGLAVARRAWSAGKKTVLSTIWWDLSETSFQRHRRLSHRIARLLLGREAHRRVYRRRWLASRRRSPAFVAARDLLAGVDAILPNSRAELRILEEMFDVPGLAAKACIIPNATLYAETRVADGPRSGVLQVAKLYHVKNQCGLLEALWRVPVDVVLVGDCSDRAYVAECRAMAARRGRVVIHDFVPQSGLPAHYGKARVHALPSFRESPGLSSLEAAAFGCAIVSTDESCADEYFGDEASYCDPGSPRDIRRAVVRSLESGTRVSPERLALLTWARVATLTSEAYRWVLGRRDGPDSLATRGGAVMPASVSPGSGRP